MLSLCNGIITYRESHSNLSQPNDEEIFHDEDGKIRRYAFTESTNELKVKDVVLGYRGWLDPSYYRSLPGHLDVVTDSVMFIE